MKNLIDFSKLTIEEVPDAAKEQFVNLLTSLHRQDKEYAEAVFEREKRYYLNAVESTTNFRSCTILSAYSSFLEIAIQNISIQPGSKNEAYLGVRGINSAPKDASPKWTNYANLVVTAYGELAMRIKAGQIIRLANPIIVYEGDLFQPTTNERGELIVKYQPAIPRKSGKIIAAYVCMYLPQNGIDFKFMLQDDIERLMKYSSKQSRESKANALYTSNGGQIDPGFLQTKCMKHAFKSLPKLKAGEFVATETDLETEQETQVASQENAYADQYNAPQGQQTDTASTTNQIEDEGGLF